MEYLDGLFVENYLRVKAQNNRDEMPLGTADACLQEDLETKAFLFAIP
jgi:hypothetical protein